MCSNQIRACSLNVRPVSCLTTLSKYSSVYAPLLTMISRARRSRSDFDKTPGPEIGHIRSRSWARLSCPATSIHYRTTHHLPLFSTWPF